MDLNRDGDVFLINIDDWSEEVMYQMAESDSFEITDEIKTYIDKAREMYGETGTVPAVRNFAKEFGMEFKNFNKFNFLTLIGKIGYAVFAYRDSLNVYNSH